MAQFLLKWFKEAVLANPSSIAQKAMYRQKSVGGNFITTGFTPANDLPKYASTTTSPDLATNVVWEFKVQATCSAADEAIDNDNGIREKAKFQCITPILSYTTNIATITLNVSQTDIKKARFTLKKVSDDSIAYGPVTNNVAGNSITANSGAVLASSTQYYWETELFLTIEGAEVASSDPVSTGGLGTPCISDTFTTNSVVCNPVTAATVSAIEVVA